MHAVNHLNLTDDMPEAVSAPDYITVSLFVILAERSRWACTAFGLAFAPRYSCLSSEQRQRSCIELLE